MDGQEIRTVTRASLRRAYSMVLQDTWLFSGTIYENIAYGREGATREEVIAAAKAAHIHNFIMALPQGYDTVLQDNGAGISRRLAAADHCPGYAPGQPHADFG